MTESHFRAIMKELIDENPFAAEPLLRSVDMSSPQTLPTVAVTWEARPRLLINPEFVRRNCRNDDT